MKDSYKIVYKGGAGEVVEKKSRFVATVEPVETDEEAFAFIQMLKKKYWNATHNCYAYVVGQHMEIQRFSDDGEPGGTAGRPILDVLLGEEIHNAAIVVTRYFGGTLLGTGGLVRAYGKAAKAGVHNCTLIEKKLGNIVEIHTDYNGIGKVQYLLGQRNLDIIHSEYTHEVAIEVLVPMAQLKEVHQAVTEATGGRGIIKKSKDVYFAKDKKELLIFE